MGKGQDLYKKAKTIIPGGTQLLSKRPEQFLPDMWPAYYSKAKGCEVWDLDGKKYVDMSYMGIGSCTLGYADDDVDAAAKDAVSRGTMCTLNAPEEVELAELLLELHPWAGMVRYARCGGEAMAVAVRIARAATGKDTVLFSGYHGWNDWYLAANLADDKALDGQLLPGLKPAGVPRDLKGSAYPFAFNDTKAFLSLVEAHGASVGAIVLEAVRNIDPDKEFFAAVRREATRLGVPLVVDEVSSGFRINLGGAHLVLGLDPDIAVFAKGMSNGYPMGAIIGKGRFMDAAQGSFISSTYWTDRIGPAATIAAIRKMKSVKAQQHMMETGKKIQEGWKAAAVRKGLNIHVGSIYPLSHFDFEYEKPLVLKTLFTQEMLAKGFLASNSCYTSYAHKEEHVAAYLKACEEVFGLILAAVKSGDPEAALKGPVCHAGFKRLS